MLGSFQRARDLLRSTVAKLQDAHVALEQQLREGGPALEAEIQDLQRRCAEIRQENSELHDKLEESADGKRRDFEGIAQLRGSYLKLHEELRAAREETAHEAERAAEAQRCADLAEEELSQCLRTEEALQEMLLFQWQLMEDLANQENLQPPWRCELCSCSNPQEDSMCGVCESPKGETTDTGSKVTEAYFEFRLHQEFLGRDPLPPPEKQLPALKIALGHRQEGWIQGEEVEELQDRLKDLAADPGVEPVLQAEAAFLLFSLGREDGRRMGRSMLKSMGETSGAVRQMCRLHRQQQVSTLYQRLLRLKQYDLKGFNEWLEKFQRAQARFHNAHTIP